MGNAQVGWIRSLVGLLVRSGPTWVVGNPVDLEQTGIKKGISAADYLGGRV